MRQNNHVIKLAAARDAMLPCIITTDADTCEGAQTRQRHMDLLRIDEANFIDLSLERRRPSLFLINLVPAVEARFLCEAEQALGSCLHADRRVNRSQQNYDASGQVLICQC